MPKDCFSRVQGTALLASPGVAQVWVKCSWVQYGTVTCSERYKWGLLGDVPTVIILSCIQSLRAVGIWTPPCRLLWGLGQKWNLCKKVLLHQFLPNMWGQKLQTASTMWWLVESRTTTTVPLEMCLMELCKQHYCTVCPGGGTCVQEIVLQVEDNGFSLVFWA